MPKSVRQKQIIHGDLDVRGKLTANQSAQTFVLDAIENEAAADLPVKLGTTPATMFNVEYVASAVNYVTAKPSATGNGVEVVAEGTDTNIDLKLVPKGTGVLDTGGEIKGTTIVGNTADADLPIKTGATAATAANVKYVASAVNYLALTPSATGNAAALAAEGTDTNIDIAITPKGTGGITTPGALAATGKVTSAAGVQARAVAVTATADGLTTGLIPLDASKVSITSADANNIARLPVSDAGNVGMEITLYTDATGCELRTEVGASATINGVNCDDAQNELALAASSMFKCELTAADKWIVRGFTAAGADAAALVPDAV